MKQKKVIGIDIGTVTTKVAEGSLDNGKIFLNNYGIYTLPELKKTDGKILNAKEWAKAFKKQLNHSKIKTKDAYLIFSDSQAIIRKLELPQMPQEKIKQNLMFQLPEYLPQSIDDYVIDYKILNVIQTEERKGYEIFVVSILKSVVADYVKMLKMANIKVKGIDVESNARGNLIHTMTNQVESNDSAFGIIDIGYRFTDVSIFQNGNYYINRVIDWGWARNIKKLLLENCRIVASLEDKCLTEQEYANLQKRYLNILTRGSKELSEIPLKPKGKRGKMAKTDVHNLWERHKKDLKRPFYCLPSKLMFLSQTTGLKGIFVWQKLSRRYLGALGVNVMPKHTVESQVTCRLWQTKRSTLS